MNNFKNNFKNQTPKKVRINESYERETKHRSLSPVKNINIIQEPAEINVEPNASKKYQGEIKKEKHYRKDSDRYRRSNDNLDYRRRRGLRVKHNPLLGDNYVDKQPTRTYVYYRQPFDWYDMDRCDVIDEFEEFFVPERPRRANSFEYYDRLDRYEDDSEHERIYSRHSGRLDPYEDDYERGRGYLRPRDRLDHYGDDYERGRGHQRQTDKSRRDPNFESVEVEEPRQRGIIKTREVITREEYEDQHGTNLFAFSERENRQRKPKSKIYYDRNEELRDLGELSENLSEISVEDHTIYKKPSRRY